MRQTNRLNALMALIRQGEGKAGIYALASAAGRPYRRVHDQVRRLVREGQVKLVPQQVNGRRRLQVVPVDMTPMRFNRAWSRPSGGVDAETEIALVLSRPAFDDLLSCVQRHGLSRVRAVHDVMLNDLELSPGAAAASTRMLNNIEVGLARAA